MTKRLKPEGTLRTKAEWDAVRKYAQVFESSREPLATRLSNFSKYVRRQDMTRLLARYEIFKKVLPVKGSIIECGVYHGFGLMAWANFSAILEPTNLTRRIYGFDSFAGFPRISDRDRGTRIPTRRELAADSYDELLRLIRIYDENRYLGHVGKVELIRGDASKTIPEFVKQHSHLVVSLLFLDFDLYDPTRIAIETFLPRMPKGAVIAFDELDNPMWPGETLALLETVGINSLHIKRCDFDPYIGYAIME